MSGLQNAQIGRFELEIALNGSLERAWQALTAEIDRWWLPDFRVTGEGSVVSLDPRAGGGLVETAADGTALLWYTVQMVQPGSALYLVGHTAADWGGPSLSMLKLALSAGPGGTLLQVSDSILGRVGESQLNSVKSGWQSLFGDGMGGYLSTGA